MAVQPPKIRGQKEIPVDIVMDTFDGGNVTLLDEARLSLTMARDSTNLMQDQDGLWTKRWGTAPYGQDISTSFDGWGVAVKDDGDGTTTQYVIVVDGGVVKRSTGGGSWTTITRSGGSAFSFTSGKRARMKQLGSKMYIANAFDDLAYYDIVNDYMVDYSGITAPANVSTARTTLTAGTYSNYYKVSAVNEVGETIATATGTANTTTNKHRDQWATDGTEYLTTTWDAVTGATGYNIYWSDTEGYEWFIGTSSVASFLDNGSNAANSFIEAPVSDTTTGPKMGALAVSGNRIWGTLDPDHPWRVYFTGTGNQLGAFNPYFGGGYVDIELGSPERPQRIEHFRDGKGNPMVVIYTTDPNGQGSTWLIELISATVGTTSIVIPSTMKVQGSNGTDATDSVVQARNALYGYNSAIGFNWLGTKPSQLNVLSADEISVNIRPSARSLTKSAIGSMTGIYYDGRIIWSVPNGSTSNNETWVLDLEQKNWSRAWTIGFKGFLEYAEANGTVRLLGVPTTGTKLLEISENYLGDSGSAYSTKYRSGLIHFDKSQVTFAWINKVHFIYGRPKGTINVSVIGTQRNKATSTLASKTITDNTSSSGIGTELISTTLISDSNNAPSTFASAAVKKTIKVNKLLNNIQVEVSTSNLADDFTLMRIIIEGRIVPINEPSSWRR